MLINDLAKLHEKINKKIAYLEEKKEYAEGKQFEKVLDKIYELTADLVNLEKIMHLYSLDTNKYKVVVISKGENL